MSDQAEQDSKSISRLPEPCSRFVHKVASLMKGGLASDVFQGDTTSGGALPVTRMSQSELTIRKMMGWISSNVADKTFADVGGIGVDAINERVTLACKSGARSATMIDIRPKEYYEWGLFHQRCQEEGICDYECLDGIDINDPDLMDKVGVYDFVNCTGVVYHLPNPVWGVGNLAKIVREYLIINTVVVPPKIKTERGSLEFSGSIAVFMPGLGPAEREILNSYYMEKFDLDIDDMAPALDAQDPGCPWFEDGETTCWPYWWLFTERSFVALVQMMGFEILDTALWENHTLALFARRKS